MFPVKEGIYYCFLGCYCMGIPSVQFKNSHLDPRRNTPKHIIITLSKIKNKERILEAAREKERVIYKGGPIRLIS